MREIKFRAWDIDCKKMIYQLYENELTKPSSSVDMFENGDNPSFIGFFEGYLSLMCTDEVTGKPEITKHEIMQFTGLKDLYGKEIYVGDIVEYCWDYPYNKEKQVGEIKFSRGVFIVDIDNGVCLYEFTDKEWNRGHYWVKIIGNIYENPELIK